MVVFLSFFFFVLELDFATTKYWQFVGVLFIYICVCVCVCVFFVFCDEEGKNVKRNGVTRCFVATQKKKIPTHLPKKQKKNQKLAMMDCKKIAWGEDCLEVLVFQEGSSSSVEVRDQYWNSGRF